MPSSARAHSTTRAPVSASARSSIASPGRTTATTSLSAAIRWVAAATPTGGAAADAVRCGRNRRQQLAAAEARAAAGGEQDADDAHRITGTRAARRTAVGRLRTARALAMPPRSRRRSRSLGQQPELAVAHDDQHARALVHPVVVGRRHVEHALRADDVALRLERVAQRDAERLGPGLAGLERRRDRAREQDAAVPRVRAERRRLGCRTASRTRRCTPARPSSSDCRRESRR